jgi:hypothetical protein
VPLIGKAGTLGNKECTGTITLKLSVEPHDGVAWFPGAAGAAIDYGTAVVVEKAISDTEYPFSDDGFDDDVDCDSADTSLSFCIAAVLEAWLDRWTRAARGDIYDALLQGQLKKQKWRSFLDKLTELVDESGWDMTAYFEYVCNTASEHLQWTVGSSGTTEDIADMLFAESSDAQSRAEDKEAQVHALANWQRALTTGIVFPLHTAQT